MWSVLFYSKCSEGTCDGCTFHFLWESQHACPLCTKNNYREIVSACIQGIQVKYWTRPNIRHTAWPIHDASLLPMYKNSINLKKTKKNKIEPEFANLMWWKNPLLYFREPLTCGRSHCSVMEESPCRHPQSVHACPWTFGSDLVFPLEP